MPAPERPAGPIILNVSFLDEFESRSHLIFQPLNCSIPPSGEPAFDAENDHGAPTAQDGGGRIRCAKVDTAIIAMAPSTTIGATILL